MQTSILCKQLDEQSTLVSRPLMKDCLELPEIIFCVMKNEHREKVLQLVIETFFRDEPLNQCLVFDLPHEALEFAELVLSIALKDQCSFVAIDQQTQDIIGVILNVIKPRLSNQFDSKYFQSEKLRFILGVLKHVHGNVDLFEQMNTDRLLHVVIVAIDTHYRGLRLTDKLIHASLERAKSEFQIHGAFSEATSLYSAKAFRKQGFQVYNELIYVKYDGTRLASLTGEHDRCQLLARHL